MDLFGKNISLEKCSMHVAPGGSAVCTLVGSRKTVGGLLSNLREEIAYGLVDVQVEADDVVRVVIYFGLADEDVFNSLCPSDLSVSRETVTENDKKDALSMMTRNQVISAL